MASELRYLSGFGNEHATEAIAGAFLPGGASLHTTFTSRGPDAATYQQASTAELTPQRLHDTLAFMFETRWAVTPTRQALEARHLQPDYDSVWAHLPRNFESR